jgi:hypothetical protein
MFNISDTLSPFFYLVTAAVDSIPELLQYVKVHLEYAPIDFCLMEHSWRRAEIWEGCRI